MTNTHPNWTDPDNTPPDHDKKSEAETAAFMCEQILDQLTEEMAKAGYSTLITIACQKEEYSFGTCAHKLLENGDMDRLRNNCVEQTVYAQHPHINPSL